nr:hypothetical protein [Rhizobium sp. AN73]
MNQSRPGYVFFVAAIGESGCKYRRRGVGGNARITAADHVLVFRLQQVVPCSRHGLDHIRVDEERDRAPVGRGPAAVRILEFRLDLVPAGILVAGGKLLIEQATQEIIADVGNVHDGSVLFGQQMRDLLGGGHVRIDVLDLVLLFDLTEDRAEINPVIGHAVGYELAFLGSASGDCRIVGVCGAGQRNEGGGGEHVFHGFHQHGVNPDCGVGS